MTLEPEALRDSVVIVNKRALEKVDLDRLKARGNAVLADPLDGYFENLFLDRFDGVIAASRAQFAYYARNLATSVAYVAHHVDARIPPIAPTDDVFALGYFGNAKYVQFRKELRPRLKVIEVNTCAPTQVGWMENLSNFNAHYLVRAKLFERGFKPFTKAFIAAHCQSPVLIAADDPEAAHILPESYPYRTRTDCLDDIECAIDLMRSSYKSQTWHDAREMMRSLRTASSIRTVIQQLMQALAPFLRS